MWPVLQQPWYFSEHHDLALDADGNVYVANSATDTILKFSAEGNFILSWGGRGTGNGQLHFPAAIAVDPNGTVWVADAGNHRVQQFDPQGEFLKTWGGFGSGIGRFNSPRGIAVSDLGTIFVSDTFNHRIQCFERDGSLITLWGSEGSGPAQFRFQRGICVDQQGHVYVADKNNHRISVFDSEGRHLSTWGAQGNQPGRFEEPHGITSDRGGRLYISDSGNHRIQVLNTSGDYITHWGTYGQAPGDLFSPRGLGIGPNGLIYVADFWNDRIQVFDQIGSYRSQWGSLSNQPARLFAPVGIALDSEDQVYVADTWNNRIQKFDADGEFLCTWGVQGDGDGQFDRPHGIALGPGGDIFVCDTYNDRIQRFTPAGEHLQTWDGPAASDGRLSQPFAIAAGADGQIYVCDGEPDGIDRVQEFTADGEFVRSWGGLGSAPGQLDSPRGIAAAPDGSILVAELGNSRIQRFSPTGQPLQVWGRAGSEPGEFTEIWGLAVDNAGRVYAGDAGNSRVQVFDPAGTLSVLVGRAGSAPGRLGYPTAVAVSSRGDLYTVEEANSRIQVFEPLVLPETSKAIVVAAGGPFPGNALWETTQYCANFAIRALLHQGYTNDDIYYLNPDSDVDLDGNGLPDDVDGDATSANLEYALTAWASGAESVVLYVVDHGGNESLRVNGMEVLDASTLAGWMGQLDAHVSGPVVVVYDACQSGTFLPLLAGDGRVIIASAMPEESAYFLSTGTISFSSFFWTQVFNGSDVQHAFEVARDAVGATIGFQTPQILDPDSLAGSVHLGNGTRITGRAPNFGDVSDNMEVTAGDTALLAANVSDADGIARTWVVIRPSGYQSPSPDNPTYALPTVELAPIAEGAARWEGRYDGFTHEGVYRLSFYCRDAIGNTSLPVQRTITVGDPMFRRAILLGGGAGRDITTESVEESLRIAYNALVSQGYGADDIRIYAPTTFTTGGAIPHPVELNVLDNLDYAFGDWLGDDTQDLLLYAVGDGGTGSLSLNNGEELKADDLAARLAQAQSRISGVLAVVLDSPRSGSFLPALASPGSQRIVIASAAAEQDICLAPQKNISFSNYFWRRVLNGANVSEAFTHAALAMSFAAMGQSAELDDDGDGLYDTAADGLLAGRYSIGSGILLAGDDPIIGTVSDPQMLDGETVATIWADDVTTTGAIQSVFAVIQLPPASAGAKANACGERPVEVVELTNANGRYEGEYGGFYFAGDYDINIVAIDEDGAVSIPEQTQITQMQSTEGPADPDAFEDDDTPDMASNIIVGGAAQAHNFHDAGDEDWAVVVVAAEQVLTFRTERLGSAGNTLLELYAADRATLLAGNDDRGPQDPSSEIRYSVTEAGLLYLRVRHAGGIFGAGTEYELRALREAGPASSGAIAGTVLDASTDDALPGLTVRLSGENDTGPFTLETTTNPAGAFQFLLLDAGSYALTVLGGAAYENWEQDTVEVADGAAPNLRIEIAKKTAPGDDDDDGKVPFACNPTCSAAGPARGSAGDGAVIGLLLALLCMQRSGCLRGTKKFC